MKINAHIRCLLVGTGIGSTVFPLFAGTELSVVRGTAIQSTAYSGGAYFASWALDNDPNTFTHTDNIANSYWQEDLGDTFGIRKIELLNRADAVPERMGGLTLRIFNSNMVSVASATVVNPGAGGTWTFTPSSPVTGKYVRVGTENGVKNQDGNYYVTLAEARVFCDVPTPNGSNLAVGKDAFMTRLTDTLYPASNANDNNPYSAVYTTTATVDGYWEVDLGALYAISSVRAIEADGLGNRLAHATLRLFDEAHQPVFSRHLAVTQTPLFTVDLGSVYVARYVRVGLENKERTGDWEWYLGFKEVQVFGRPAEEVGILDFGASRTNIVVGQSATLSWQASDVRQILLCTGDGPATNVTGRSSQTVTPTRSVCYTLVATNACRVYERSVTLVVDAKPPSLRIEEFVADNETSFEDGYGEAPDWIELRNLTAEAVNLEGYGLSDNPSKPMKWTFPNVSLPAWGRLVVCASGKSEKIDPAGFVHTSWSLAAEGENIVLTAPDGVTRLDQVLAYPAQGKDLAYARDLNGVWGFQEPTPGELNLSARYTGWLKAPDFSVTRGFFTNAFSLALQDKNTGSTLLFSTNGGEPSTVYTGPLAITRTTSVRATANRSGYKPPRTKTNTFIFPEDTVTSPVMNTAITQDPRYATRIRKGLRDLPVFSLSIPEVADDYYERECSMEILWPDGSQAPLQANCGMEQFGGSYQEFAKKSWRLNFRKEFGTGKLKAPLFNGFDHGFPVRETFNKVELRSCSQDMADRGFYMAARFVDDTMLDMGSLNPHGRYAHLYLNGVYWGQYDLREALDDAFLANYLGGKQEDYLVVRGNDNMGDSFVTGAPDPINRQSWYRVRTLGSSYQSVKSYLDVPNLIDFMLLWLYGNCEAEYRCAGSVEAGSGFKFWMADSDGFLRTSAMGLDWTSQTGPGDLFGKLRTEGDPDFKVLLADRIQRHFFNGGALTPARVSARLTARMAEVQDSLIAECARWNYRTPDNWVSAATTIQTDLFPGRTAQLFGYLRAAGLYPAFDAPALSQQGGMVTNGTRLTLTSSAGTVYYTLDGTDPRLPGGAIAPGALVFSSAGFSQTLVPSNAVWRYWDRNGRGDTAWRNLGFDDSTWASGAAKLGYADTPTTTISYGPDNNNKYITSYFRTGFYVGDAGAVDRLQIQLLRDDGAVLYLNGAELLRDNMPAGTVLSNTLAAAAVGGADEYAWYAFDLPSQGLLTGTNVLAVEIHQSRPDSTDLSFNLSLSAYGTRPIAPIILAGNTVVKSRVWTGTAWSALNEASFYLPGREPASPANLLITEIHYDPPGYADGEQFVELMNMGTNQVDLSGVALAEAVNFVFPNDSILDPGGMILVVEDAGAFSALYQVPASPWYCPGLRVAGEWAGALANNGETLSLWASNGVEIASVTYAADGDWPTRAAGRGSSLELANPMAIPMTQPAKNTALNRPSSWRSSSLYQGSPGRLDTGRRSLVINEVLSHTDADSDWIELRNVGTETENLSGLCLSDDWDQPFRHMIPADTKLGPGLFICFNRSQLGFGFSELGSDALLIEASGTNVLRFLDTVDFPAAAREEPFGRFTRSDGVTDFTELRAKTPGATNAWPRVGPVVISEIMAEPAPGHAEYVALFNLSDQPVALFDTNHTENAWELSGAVDFRFPANPFIPPHAAVIVCATNGAAFRAQYAVDPSVPVYGPWSGQLDNAGESIKLRQPGAPEPDGFVPYYRVDRVTYSPAAPWPAMSSGVGIVRAPLQGYGNDPASWQACALGASPGSGPPNQPPVLAPWADFSYPVGASLDVSLEVHDDDLPVQPLLFSQIGLPHGFVLDGSARRVTGCGQTEGTYPVVIVVSDGQHPPLSATNAFTLSLTEPMRMRFDAVVSETGPRMSVPTVQGQAYQIEYTDQLVPVDWHVLHVLPSAASNAWHFADPTATNHPQRFYRMKWLR